MNIVGHRGFPEKFPENSLSGLEAACAAGVHGVEIDIQFSRDGVPFLFHDADLLRVTGMHGLPSHYDAEVLMKMSAHEPTRFGHTHLPTPMATLEQAVPILERYPQTVFFVEIKEDAFQFFSRESVVATIGAILQPIAEQRVIISYDLAVLRLARDELASEVGWVLTGYDENSRLLATEFQPEYLIGNVNKLPTAEPLWQGLWQWFIYDIVDPEKAAYWSQQGVGWIETWNPELLLLSRAARDEEVESV